MDNFIITVDLMQKVLEYNSTRQRSETNDEGNAVIPDVKNDGSKLLVIFNLHEVHLTKNSPKVQVLEIKPKRKQDFGNEKPVITLMDLHFRMSLMY